MDSTGVYWNGTRAASMETLQNFVFGARLTLRKSTHERAMSSFFHMSDLRLTVLPAVDWPRSLFKFDLQNLQRCKLPVQLNKIKYVTNGTRPRLRDPAWKQHSSVFFQTPCVFSHVY